MIVLCLVVLALIAIRVRHDITRLEQFGDGVAQAGTSVQRGLGAAASAVSNLPLVGGQLSSGLRAAGAHTGATAVQAGRQSNHAIAAAATLLAWLIFLVPGLALLAAHLPSRVRQIHRLTAAGRMLTQPPDAAQTRMLAQRAAFSLSYRQLLRHSRQPMTDLENGHYRPLIDALPEDVGLRSNPADTLRGTRTVRSDKLASPPPTV